MIEPAEPAEVPGPFSEPFREGLGIDPSAPTLYHRVVYAAAEHVDAPLVEAAGPRVFMVRSDDADHGVTVVALGGSDDALAEGLRSILARSSVERMALVIVGPSGDAERFAAAARPRVARGGLTVGGYDPRGGSWGELPEGPLRSVLDAQALDWSAFSELVSASEEWLASRAYSGGLAARPTRVTYALVAVNVLFFGLEVFFGGGVDPTVPLLVRMGGVSGALVAEGEVWRLVSSAFLHGGLMHLGFNMLVLVIIGRLIERVIGPQRFLILYTACALAGALASTLIMDAPVSVGASGALWGVLAAEGVLAFTPGFLPASIVSAAKRAAVINLVLNVANSFRPHVDWAAHLGGGLVGAALLWLVLSRGVPRGEALATEEIRPLRFGKLVAGACALLLAVGAIAGPVMGRAWEMRRRTPSYERVEVSELGGSLEVPSARATRSVVRDPSSTEVTFGSLVRDRAVLAVRVFAIPANAARGQAEEVLHRLLAAPPERADVVSPIEAVEIDGRRATQMRYRYPSGLRLDRVFVFEPEGYVRFDVYYWPAEAEYGRSIAARAASTWRRLSE